MRLLLSRGEKRCKGNCQERVEWIEGLFIVGASDADESVVAVRGIESNGNDSYD